MPDARPIPYRLPADAVLGLDIYHAARRARRLLVPRCRACSQYHWYPRPFCPFCHGEDLDWPEASGRGTIYTYSIMRRAKPVYTIAYVTLEEGPIMMSSILGCSLDAIAIGKPVHILFVENVEGEPFPAFTLA
jgi:uncharacterized OB-fold protein